jgi:uncharacterized protein (TIGR00251 family)
MQIKSQKFKDGKSGAALAIRVSPRAKINQIKEFLDDGTVKIAITASPVDGKANNALVKYLADILDIPQSQIEIVAGLSSKNKLISIYDMDAALLQKRLTDALQENS